MVFTSGATAALRLVAEAYACDGGVFLYTRTNHTSVVGMREVLAERAERVVCVEDSDVGEVAASAEALPRISAPSLFVFPAQVLLGRAP